MLYIALVIAVVSYLELIMENLTPTSESPERIEQALNILRLWIQQQRHLCMNLSDRLIVALLKCCRFSLEATKKRIDLYCSSFTIFPEVMCKRQVNPRILEINKSGVHFFPRPVKCPSSDLVLITRVSAIDYSRYSSLELLRYYTMATEIIALENEKVALCGISIILDMKRFNMSSIHYSDSEINKKFYFWATNACPVRINRLFLTNVSTDYFLLYYLQRLFLRTEDVSNTFYVRSPKQLLNYFPLCALPEEYGGTNGSITDCIHYMDEKLRQYRSYFDKQAECGTRDELRFADLPASDTGFGPNGTFRKLLTDCQ